MSHAVRPDPGPQPSTDVRAVAAMWAKYAEALADWALTRLVVRKDACGAYGKDGGPFTSRDPLTRERLIRHFRGEITIGFHSISTEGRCLGAAWDIDAHVEQVDQVTADENLKVALRTAELAGNVGLEALICDSDGKGGFHVRVFFKSTVPSAVAYWLCERVKATLKEEGFTCREGFPKQPELTLDHPYGNWIRGPGRHPKRGHWTRIYDRDRKRWLEGKPAILRLLKVRGDDPKQLLDACKAEEAAKEKAAEKPTGKGKSKKRPEEYQSDTPDEARIRSALDCLPADWADQYGGETGNTAWLGVGMALHDWDTSRGLPLWHEFSGRSAKYDSAACDAKWTTFTQGGGLTVATIFDAAWKHGWKPPPSNGTTAGPRPSSNGDTHGPGPDVEVDVRYESLSDDDLGIIDAHKVTPEEIEWECENRRAIGKFDLLAGDGGDGKSQLAIADVAAITSGGKFPDGTACSAVGVCLILAAEDGQRDTIIPRLIAAGADLTKVKFITANVVIRGKDGRTLIHFASFQDLAYWEAIFDRLGPRLLVADPLPAFLGRGVNDHRNCDVRQILEPFVKLLEKSRVAMCGITHLGKSVDLRTPVHKILGSVAYSNLARIVHITVRDPEDKDRRLLCQPKNNLGPLQPALAFRVVGHEFKHEDKTIRTSRVVFEEGTFDVDARDLMAANKGPARKKPGPEPVKVVVAAEWLFDHLSAQRGATPLGAIFDAAGAAGHVGEKKNNKWSNPRMLYLAREYIIKLTGERAGYRVDDFEIRSLRTGNEIKHWQLVASDPGPVVEAAGPDFDETPF